MQPTRPSLRGSFGGWRAREGRGKAAPWGGLDVLVSRLSRSRAFVLVVLVALQLATLPPVSACVGGLGLVAGLECCCCPDEGVDEQPQEQAEHGCCSTAAPVKRGEAQREGPELSPAGESCGCGPAEDLPPATVAEVPKESRGRGPTWMARPDASASELVAPVPELRRLRAPPERALWARGGSSLRALHQVFLL